MTLPRPMAGSALHLSGFNNAISRSLHPLAKGIEGFERTNHTHAYSSILSRRDYKLAA